jgi:hypothetical protein
VLSDGRSLVAFARGDQSPLPTSASGPRGPCFALVAPRGTARSALTGTVGKGRSRLKTARDGPKPLRITAHNATRARLRFDDIVSRTEAHHRGTGKPAQKAPRAISSSREVAQPRVAGHNALGIISSAPVAYEPSIADDDLRTPNGHRKLRRRLAQTRRVMPPIRQHDRRSSSRPPGK